MSTKIQDEYRTPNTDDQKKYTVPYNNQNTKGQKKKKKY